MAAAKDNVSPQSIIENIKKKNFKPVYFLMGEEPYFIDLITDALIDNVVPEEYKDFDMTIMYGADVSINTIVSTAKRYPMMSQYQLIVVKEAQMVDSMEKLEFYTRMPMPTTVLVINYKTKTFDARTKAMKDIASMGIVFNSKKVYENQLPSMVKNHVMAKGFSIDEKAVHMMCDFIGADLNRLFSEIEKLCILVAKQKRITADDVEKNIGISKDFNNFELIKAVAAKDYYKANLIQKYFEGSPKLNPLIATIAVLYNYFSNLILSFWAPDKSPNGLKEFMGLNPRTPMDDYMMGIRNYNAFKVLEIISLLREYDAKAKGVNATNNLSDGDNLKELLFKIMN